MAWVDPEVRAAGYLITVDDDWNRIVNDLKHLRGQDGTTVLEGDVDPNTDLTQNMGSFAKRWGQIWANKMYAGNGMMTLHRGTVREEVFNWTDLIRGDWNILPAGSTDLGNGDFDEAGTGQVVLWVLNNNLDGIYLGPRGEQHGGKDNSWNAGRNPYACFPFNLSENHADVVLWIGFRQTLGNAVPSAAAEKYAGLHFDGSAWNCEQADGSSETQEAISAPTANVRHVLEILITGGTNVIYAIDGTIVKILTGTLPTGDLDWTVMMRSVDTAGGDTFYGTVGRLLFQESLA